MKTNKDKVSQVNDTCSNQIEHLKQFHTGTQSCSLNPSSKLVTIKPQLQALLGISPPRYKPPEI